MTRLVVAFLTLLTFAACDGCATTQKPITPAKPALGTIQYDHGDPDLIAFEKSLHLENVLREIHTKGAMVPVRFATCDTVNAFYFNHKDGIVICHEWAAYMLAWDEVRTPGSLRMTLYHEMGHSIFDGGKIAYTGLEEAAADEYAAVMSIWHGREQDVLDKAAFWAEIGDNEDDGSDPHPTSMRRAHELRCLVAGATGIYEDLDVFDMLLCGEKWTKADKHWRQLLAQ